MASTRLSSRRRRVNLPTGIGRDDYTAMIGATVESSTRIWRYEDYTKLEDEQRHEVTAGRLSMVPAATTEHQTLVFNLTAELRSHNFNGVRLD